MDEVATLLDIVRRTDARSGQLSHVEELPARPAQYGEPATPLPAPLAELLARQGIDRLYCHQAQSLDLARAGRDWVVVTGTASGKTLCYHLPILERCLADPAARALYLFPTKALAQDQLRGLQHLLGRRTEGAAPPRRRARRALAAAAAPAGLFGADDARDLAGQSAGTDAAAPPPGLEHLLCGVYDGDTPVAQRRRIQAEAQLVLSNPDMLHASLLPYHGKWARFFADLQYVVLDEAHTYRGIFGAHVACVLRRLQRVCEHYGSRPVFLSASATIANPAELVGQLLGRPVEVVADDGSPRGRKFFVLWNPAPLGDDRLARRSASDDAVQWLVRALENTNVQALAFTRTRQQAELIHRYVQEALARTQSPAAEQVRAYRGGYLPNERRQVESDLFAGRLRAVAATNALELGIDVGSLDVVLLVGYPGTIASCWQQAGRAGRRATDSLAVLLAGNDPIDQYLLRHPAYFFAQTPEQAVVDPANPYVLARHLKTAAFELPLSTRDADRFGPLAADIAGLLCDSGELNAVAGDYYFAGSENPAPKINLRHMSDNTFSIVQKRSGQAAGDPPPAGRAGRALGPEYEVIANVDSISAPELVYPEAVYLHDGETYLVRQLDLVGKVAYVERAQTDYYTQAVLESNVRITRTKADRPWQSLAQTGYAEADVTWQTVAFKKIKFGTRENVGLGPVDIPAQTLSTTSCWLTPAEALGPRLKQAGLRLGEGLCGVRNLALTALPLLAMCDSRDLGGVVDSQNFGRSTLILYDRYPGGLGYCQRGYERIGELLALCCELVRQCPCADGCPSCVGLPNLRPAIHADPDLTRGYPIPDKQAAVLLLELLLGDPSATS